MLGVVVVCGWRRFWKWTLTCQVAAVGGADFGERVDSVLGAEHDGLGGVVVEVGVRCAVQGPEALRGGRLGVRQLWVGRKNTNFLTILQNG